MSRVEILRPAAAGLGARLAQWALAHADIGFAILRRFRPIARLGGTVLVTRHDDVREVFLADADFPVPYDPKLDIIMGGQPFFLGMGDTPDYRRDTAALRLAVRRDDIAVRLAAATTARAAALIDAAPGRIDVVDYARTVTFDVLCPYFGIGEPAGGDLRVWATRLFEFQFADPRNDPALRREVDVIAPALRAHVDGLIAARRLGGDQPDDVLGRCLALQAEGRQGFSDAQIRTGLIGLLVGGLPQPPMAVPQALEQLLRRTADLDGAVRAAHAGDDALLGGYLFEALRFDPLAPVLPRLTARDHVLAAGTRRATTIKQGNSVLVSVASAMRDPRRIGDPERFEPRRMPHDYLHFGHGLHTCFGLHINHGLLPLMLKPLLLQPNLRRVPGTEGRLTKRGVFADELWVAFG